MALTDLVPFSDVDANVLAYWNLAEASSTTTWDNGEGTAGWDAVPASGSEPAVSASTVNGNWTNCRIGDNNDYASFADPGFPTGGYTIEMIIKGDDTPTDTEAIIAQYPTVAGNRGFFIHRETTRTITFGASTDGTNFKNVTSATATTNGQWHYVVAVFEPSTAVRIYIDGTLDNSFTTTIPATMFNATSDIMIMRYNATWGGANAFDGFVQGIRISDVARDATFISNYWTNTGGGGGGGGSTPLLSMMGVGT